MSLHSTTMGAHRPGKIRWGPVEKEFTSHAYSPFGNTRLSSNRGVPASSLFHRAAFSRAAGVFHYPPIHSFAFKQCLLLCQVTD